MSQHTIKLHCTGEWKNTTSFLKRLTNQDTESKLRKVAEWGVEEFKKATPKDSGLLSDSWGYEILKTHDGYTVRFLNSNIQNGINIALLVNDGHATAGGKWVEGKHYLEEPTQKIFEKILTDVWEEINSV